MNHKGLPARRWAAALGVAVAFGLAGCNNGSAPMVGPSNNVPSPAAAATTVPNTNVQSFATVSETVPAPVATMAPIALPSPAAGVAAGGTVTLDGTNVTGGTVTLSLISAANGAGPNGSVPAPSAKARGGRGALSIGGANITPVYYIGMQFNGGSGAFSGAPPSFTLDFPTPPASSLVGLALWDPTQQTPVPASSTSPAIPANGWDDSYATQQGQLGPCSLDSSCVSAAFVSSYPAYTFVPGQTYYFAVFYYPSSACCATPAPTVTVVPTATPVPTPTPTSTP